MTREQAELARRIVAALADAEAGEEAEDAIRKDFLPSEIDAIRRAMEPVEKAAAKERMSDGGKGAKVSHPSRATDKIGTFAGVSGRTVEKIAKVVEAAERETFPGWQRLARVGARVGMVESFHNFPGRPPARRAHHSPRP